MITPEEGVMALKLNLSVDKQVNMALPPRCRRGDAARPAGRGNYMSGEIFVLSGVFAAPFRNHSLISADPTFK
jgi:hypothetical protein